MRLVDRTPPLDVGDRAAAAAGASGYLFFGQAGLESPLQLVVIVEFAGGRCGGSSRWKHRRPNVGHHRRAARLAERQWEGRHEKRAGMDVCVGAVTFKSWRRRDAVRPVHLLAVRRARRRWRQRGGQAAAG